LTGAVIKILPSSETVSHQFLCSPDGRYCAFFNQDNVEVFETKAWKSIGKLAMPMPNRYNLAFSENGELLWLIGEGKVLKGYACADLSLKFDTGIQLKAGDHRLTANPNGESLALVDEDSVRFFNIEKKAIAGGIRLPMYLTACSFRFSPDGKYLAIGTWGADLQIWDLGSGRMLWRTDFFREEVTAIRFSPDGRFIVVGMRNGQLQIIDFKRQVSMLSLDLGDEVTDIGFDAGGKHLFVMTVTGYKIMAWEPMSIIQEWQKASAESFLTYQQLQQYDIVNMFSIKAQNLDRLQKEFGSWQLKAFADWLGNPLVFSSDLEGVQASFQKSDKLYDFVEAKLQHGNIRQDHYNMLSRWQANLEANPGSKAPFDLRAKQEKLKTYVKSN
jgi:WD40 repeat protein